MAEMDGLVEWLAQETLFPKVYWREKGREFAGVGEKIRTNDIPLACEGERYFGGIAFAPASGKDATWKSFPRCCFFVPDQTREQTLIATPFAFQKSNLISRQDTPDFEAWEKGVDGSLEAIRKGVFQKIVLARRTTLTFSEKIDPFALIQAIGKNLEHETLFAFQFSPEAIFIGATPEKLYHREGAAVFSEAIAGTQPRGKAQFNSSKLKQEFSYVKQWIESRLHELCHEVREEKERLIATRNMEHLYHRILGELRSGVTDQDLLRSLHPTPAMGGFPRNPALSHLFSHELFDRGWYAAPLGYIGKQESSFAVGIRSALICGREVHLFAGAGIVEGSDAREEWEELEMKIGQFTEVLV